MTRWRVARWVIGSLAVCAVAIPGVAMAVDRGGAEPQSGPLHIMLTNDDGPTASGQYLTVVRDALCAAGNDVTVVVPSTDQSGNGTRITVKGSLSAATSTFTCGSKQGTQYAISASTPANASPADAVLFGLKVVFADHPPDLVVSGMNPGGNFGRVTNHSGTVGAAVTAIEQGLPAIAVSMEYDATDATRGFAGAAAARPAAAKFVADLVGHLRQARSGDKPLLPEGGLNINWPVAYDQAGLTVVPPGGAELTRIGTGESIVLGYLPAVAGAYPISAGICGLPTPCAAETRQHADTTALAANRISISPLDGDWSSDARKDLDKLLRPMLTG
jgi:5'/3'-nucleotidase SurE